MFLMKIFLLLLPCLVLVSCVDNTAQNNTKPRLKIKDTTFVQPEARSNPYAGVDVSPMDMSYFPVDYPMLKMANPDTIQPFARVIYSRPHLQGRQLFHGLLNYGEPWRLGANEATELDLFANATIQNKKIKAGRYIIYCIPQVNKWTIVLNKNIDSWGLKQDFRKDVDRFTIPVKQTSNHLEYFTMVFEKDKEGANLIMAWDNVEARLPIAFLDK